MTVLDDSIFRTSLLELDCCRQRVNGDGYLTLGFGKRITHGSGRRMDTYRGEWEIGTWTSSWRITKRGAIVVGSQDEVNSKADLDQKLALITFGRISSIRSRDELDVVVEFNNGIKLEVLATSDADDEMFHIFGPEHWFLEYSLRRSWVVGKSNVPWNPD